MPGKVKVKVVAGRSLPVMDRSNDTTDAYVEVKLGQSTYKTDVCRKSLNPQWNSEWFKFEMDDMELQDEPLQIRVMDYDTYSANDAIGKIYLDLSPMLISSQSKDNKTISGWIPIYDTMHGLRGEISVIVKLELFSDLNKYRQSSCGVRFFFSPHVPEGFVAHSINGFVEELLINDDPEYQWIDKIRTPRSSNEARQILFKKLSGEVQRKVGLKALELGGNAVVGYKQCIDLEGESGLIIRGIGTAMYITKLSENQSSPIPLGAADGSKESQVFLSSSTLLPHIRHRHPSPTISSPHLLCSDDKEKDVARPPSHSLRRARSTSPTLKVTPTLDSAGIFPINFKASSIDTQQVERPHRRHPSGGMEGVKVKTLSEIVEDRVYEGSPKSPTRKPWKKTKSLPPPLSLDTSDCSVSEESPPTSPSSATGSSKFSLLRLRKHHHWLTKKDRLSTNCLMKRASYKTDPSTSSVTKMKEEFGKILKRISFGDSDDEDKKHRPYRRPRKFFFRKRRRRSDRSLTRSASDHEHHPCPSGFSSVHQTSCESLPSLGSEPPMFHLPEDDDPETTSLTQVPIFLQSQVVRPELNLSHDQRKSKKSESKDPSSAVSVDRNKLRELIGDLGYDTSKPLKLYISSLDALLVYDPLCDACIRLNVKHEEDQALSGPLQIQIKEKLDNLLAKRPESDKGDIAITTSSTSSSTTSSTSSSVTSATSSSCKGFMAHSTFVSVNKRLKMRRTDDEIVDDLELFVKESVKSGHVVTGCRSPIPEEFSESCQSETPTLLSTSPTKPIPAVSPTNGFDKENDKMIVNGSPTKAVPMMSHNKAGMQRRSSEPDLSTAPKGTNFISPKTQIHSHRPITINIGFLQMQEFPFITMSAQFPDSFIQYLGGTVTARSVKLLKSIGNFEEPSPETRDGWWNELRIEMRSHLRSFGCNVILNYEEHSTVWDEVAILSASGTAAIIIGAGGGGVCDVSGEGDGLKEHRRTDSTGQGTTPSNGLRTSPKTARRHPDSDNNGGPDVPCSMLHIPHINFSLPTILKKSRCIYCKKAKVPDVLLATIELPTSLPTTGRSCLIQTQVFRSKKESRGEVAAKEMSDSLPFLEYELHRRLINKLKIKGMNAIFGLKVQIIQSDKVVVGMATGTAVFLTALPVPSLPSICAGSQKTDAQKVSQFQKVIQETFDKNREIFGLKNITVPPAVSPGGSGSGTTGGGMLDEDDSDEDVDERELDTKDIFVLEVDDAEDIDIISMLIDPSVPIGYNMSNIEALVGISHQRVVSQQMFTQLWRCKIPTISQRQLNSYFDRLLRVVSFKLRRMQPYILSKMLWNISLPEADELQLCVFGTALGLDKKSSQLSLPSTGGKNPLLDVAKPDETDMIFPLDEDKDKVVVQRNHALVDPDPPNPSLKSPMSSTPGCQLVPAASPPSLTSPLSVNIGPGMNNVNNPAPVSKMRHWVEISPLSSIPGTKMERYLGNLNFYFIRETSSLRECGGIDTFTNALFTDILAIVRAHVFALGGNAIVSYFMNKSDMTHNQHKNQWQCVINVGGDAVSVTYPNGAHPADGIFLP